MSKSNAKTDEKTINDMAETMRGYGEGVTRETLLMHFSQEEVSRLEGKARELARSQSVTQISR